MVERHSLQTGWETCCIGQTYRWQIREIDGATSKYRQKEKATLHVRQTNVIFLKKPTWKMPSDRLKLYCISNTTTCLLDYYYLPLSPPPPQNKNRGACPFWALPLPPANPPVLGHWDLWGRKPTWTLGRGGGLAINLSKKTPAQVL